jgi:putative membrane protein
MENIYKGLALLTGIIHFYFMALEMYFWNKPLGLKVFAQTLAQAEASHTLAINQGFYNGMLAVGLFWGILGGVNSIALFCLFCVFAAGIAGALTVSPKIFFVQSLPAFFALMAYYFISRSGMPA